MNSLKEIRTLLESYQTLLRRIELIEAEIDTARIEREQPPPAGVSVYIADEYQRVTDQLLAKLWELRVSAQKKRKLLVSLVDEAETEGQRLVLWYRYIRIREGGKTMTWTEIGERIGYTEKHCCAIGREGIESIASRWNVLRKKYLKK